jgi:hypothetical protein
MDDRTRNDLADAHDAFVRFAIPWLREVLGGGDFYPLESAEENLSPLCRIMDTDGGTDWLFDRGGWRGVLPIGGRVQWDCAYATFTLRWWRWSGNMTEIPKLKVNLPLGLGSRLTVQAYVSGRRSLDKKLLAIGAVATRELFQYADVVINEFCGGWDAALQYAIDMIFTKGMTSVGLGPGLGVGTVRSDRDVIFLVVDWAHLTSVGIPTQTWIKPDSIALHTPMMELRVLDRIRAKIRL